MIIYELREIASRTGKELHLRYHATPLDLKMFNYAFNKDYSFGVKFSDYSMERANLLQDPTEADFELLDALRSRELSGDVARTKVKQHCAVHGPLVMAICNKQLQCGVTATTVNNVFKGTIPQFKLQLAKALPLDSIVFPVYAETKYDGVRIAILYEDEKVTFKTRNGLVVNLPETAQLILDSDLHSEGMLDTEVTLYSGSTLDRTRVSGMINSAMKGGTIDESLLVFNVFDCMSIKAFHTCDNQYTYAERRVFVLGAVAALSSTQFPAATSWLCGTQAEVSTIYDSHIDCGMEGLILKHADSGYTFKRTTAWAKMKETKTADLVCTGLAPGEGKYWGKIGALICEGECEGLLVRVKAGSGLTDADRMLPQSAFVGKTIELKYNTVVTDKVTGRASLFLPRFVTVRIDK